MFEPILRILLADKDQSAETIPKVGTLGVILRILRIRTAGIILRILDVGTILRILHVEMVLQTKDTDILGILATVILQTPNAERIGDQGCTPWLDVLILRILD